MIKSFAQYLLEVTYSDRHPEVYADSRLMFMAMKHHLRNPENFKKFVSNPEDSGKDGGLASAFHRTIKHTVDVQDLELDPELKKKYRGVKLGLGPNNKGLLNIVSHTRGTTDPMKRVGAIGYILGKRPTVGMNVHGLPSLEPKHVAATPLPKLHREVEQDMNKRFETWAHEFTHVHDQVVKGMELKAPPKTGDQVKDVETYYNQPHEVRATAAQLDYRLGKAMRDTPHWFKGGIHKPMKVPDEMRKKQTPGDRFNLDDHDMMPVRVLHRLEHQGPETHPDPRVNAIKALQRTFDPQENFWAQRYVMSTPEHRKVFSDIVQKHVDQNKDKLDAQDVVPPSTTKGKKEKKPVDDITRSSRQAAQKRYRERQKKGISLKPSKKAKK